MRAGGDKTAFIQQKVNEFRASTYCTNPAAPAGTCGKGSDPLTDAERRNLKNNVVGQDTGVAGESIEASDVDSYISAHSGGGGGSLLKKILVDNIASRFRLGIVWGGRPGGIDAPSIEGFNDPSDPLFYLPTTELNASHQLSLALLWGGDLEDVVRLSGGLVYTHDWIGTDAEVIEGNLAQPIRPDAIHGNGLAVEGRVGLLLADKLFSPQIGLSLGWREILSAKNLELGAVGANTSFGSLNAFELGIKLLGCFGTSDGEIGCIVVKFSTTAATPLRKDYGPPAGSNLTGVNSLYFSDFFVAGGFEAGLDFLP